MIPLTRREKILDELKNNEIVYIEDIARKVGTSEQTIRRDLMYLEKNGLVERFHGGAAKLIDTSRELSVSQRLQRFSESKEAIGEKAASLVEDGDVIFLDGGTTTAAVLNHLHNKDVTVFTNGIMHISILEKMNIKSYVIGGEMKRKTGCFIGPIAIQAIKKCSFDKVFIGANGVSLKMGYTNADINESELKAALISHSKQAFILSDSTKFGIESFHQFSTIDDSVTLITNSIPEAYEKKIKSYLLSGN